MAGIMSGYPVSRLIYSQLNSRIQKLGFRPRLASLLIGQDPGSEVYISRKKAAAEKIGIDLEIFRFPAEIGLEEVKSHILNLNQDPKFHGVLVQLPLPPHLCEKTVCNLVDPRKDVDGFTSANLGCLVQAFQHSQLKKSFFPPCTALAVKEILKFYFPNHKHELEGRNAVVIGRSLNVGLPIGLMLQADSRKGGFDMTTTFCHRQTKDLRSHTLRADLLVSAVGVPGLVTETMIKPEAIAIDVGLTRTKDNKVVGDVSDGAKKIVESVTPVPGGVGPCTVACLLQNTVLAAERQCF